MLPATDNSPQASRSPRALSIVALAALLGLSACTPVAQRPEPMQPQPAAPVQPQPASASRQWLDLAAQARSPYRENFQLRAAEAYLDEGREAEALGLVQQIQPQALDVEGRARRELVLARIEAGRGQSGQVLDRLAPPASDLPPELRRSIHEVRARSFLERGNYLESARERVLLEPLLEGGEAQEANHQGIWEALLHLNPIALRFFQSAGEPGRLNGWLELAAIFREQGGDPARLRLPFEEWRDRNPDHPALHDLFPRLLGEGVPEVGAYPARIALLLPLSGKLAPAGQVVRDGFLAGYYRALDQGVTTELGLYDTAGDPQRVTELYRQALAEGAELVVGPLAKEGVAALATLAGVPLERPVLGLNQLAGEGGGLPDNLYRFGLLPEEEARGVATRAWLDGHARALALVPEGEWGERLRAAFEAHWAEYGGELLETGRYDPAASDFAEPIRQLLDLDQSELRYQALRRELRLKLEFEPRRRQDADLIFLAAFPRQARLIRPQLRFHRAGDLPVYATSHIFSGTPDPAADKDMDGLLLCDMPWTLEEDPRRREIEALWPRRDASYTRLYALGLDAFRLAPYLAAGTRGPASLFVGATGSLRLEADGHIGREMSCARFEGGLPRSLDPAEALVGEAELREALAEEPVDEVPIEMEAGPEPGPEPGPAGGGAGPGVPEPPRPQGR